MSKPIKLINDENICQIITRVPNNREIYETLKEELRHLYFNKNKITHNQYKCVKGMIRNNKEAVVNFINKYVEYDFINFYSKYISTKRPYMICKKKIVFPDPVKMVKIDISLGDKNE